MIKYVEISALADKDIKKTKKGAYYYINKKGNKVYVDEKEIKEMLKKEKTPPPPPVSKKATDYLKSLKDAPKKVVSKVEEFDLGKKLSDHLKQRVDLSRDAIKHAAKVAAADGMRKMWDFVKENPGIFLMTGSPSVVIPPGGRTRIHTWPGKDQVARNIDKQNLVTLVEKESSDIADSVKQTVKRGISEILVKLFKAG